MTTIQFPDISEWSPVSLSGAPQVIARATISTVTDTHWYANVADARALGINLYAYCFLNSGRLGVTPEDQARYAFDVVGNRPTMLDHEPNRGQCATFIESLRWLDTFRALGGVCHLDYLPRWTWANPAGVNGLGRPNLQPLADRGIALVESNYTTYSDSGPGWQPYYANCPVPVVQWQFSSTHVFNGVRVDWNAYRGTPTDYDAMMTNRPRGGPNGDDMPAQAEGSLPLGFAFDAAGEWLPQPIAQKKPIGRVGPAGSGFGPAWLNVSTASGPVTVRWAFQDANGDFVQWQSATIDLFSSVRDVPIPDGCTDVLIGRQQMSASDASGGYDVNWRVQHDFVS